MSRLRLAAVTVVLITVTAAACAGTMSPESEGDSSASSQQSASGGSPIVEDMREEEPIFAGTAQEYSAQLRACLEDNGIETEDPEPGQDPLGFSLSLRGFTDEEYLAIVQECSEQVGNPYYDGMYEDELRRRYDARIRQFECFKENGWLAGEPMSFELFVADFEKSGNQSMWVPGLDIPAQEWSKSPGDVCPLGSL